MKDRKKIQIENYPAIFSAYKEISRGFFLAYSKLLSMEVYDTKSTPYGATDGLRLYLNCDAVSQLKKPQIAFLLAHEAMHALLGHCWRRGSRNPKLWNIAADYIINDYLMSSTLGKAGHFQFIEGGLLDPALSGNLSTEALYRKLLCDQNQQQRQPQAGDAPGDGGGDIVDLDEDAQGNTDKESVAKAAQEAEIDNERLWTAEAARQKAAGEQSTNGIRATDRADAAGLPWPEMLREWLTGRTREGWDKPFNAAVYTSTGLVSAGRERRACGTLVLVLDTSGSISESTYARFLAEAQAVLDELHPEELHLLSVSCSLMDAVVLEDGGMVPDKLRGGGGTRFQPAFDYVREHGIDPEAFVYLTDGYSSDLDQLQEPEYPVLWLTYGLPANQYPFGNVYTVEED